MKENLHYFGEWVEIRSEEEKVEAEIFLQSWKKFFLRRMPDLELVIDQIVDKPNLIAPGIGTIGIKIGLKGKLPENVIRQKLGNL